MTAVTEYNKTGLELWNMIWYVFIFWTVVVELILCICRVWSWCKKKQHLPSEPSRQHDKTNRETTVIITRRMIPPGTEEAPECSYMIVKEDIELRENGDIIQAIGNEREVNARLSMLEQTNIDAENCPENRQNQVLQSENRQSNTIMDLINNHTVRFPWLTNHLINSYTHFKTQKNVCILLRLVIERTFVLLVCCGQLTFANASLLTLCMYKKSIFNSLQAALLTLTTILSIFLSLVHMQKSAMGSYSEEEVSRIKASFYLGAGIVDLFVSSATLIAAFTTVGVSMGYHSVVLDFNPIRVIFIWCNVPVGTVILVLLAQKLASC